MGAVERVVVRAVPSEDMALLAEQAEAEGRSLEAQLRHAIRMSVEPIKIERERLARATGLARRLQFAHATFLERNPGHHAALSIVAEQIGLQAAEPVHEWFCGGSEPTFSQTRDLAAFFGCDAAWLQHGVGTAYPSATEERMK